MKVMTLERNEDQALKIIRNEDKEYTISGRNIKNGGYQGKLQIELTEEEQESSEVRHKHINKTHAFSLIGMKYSPLGKAENKVKRTQINLTPHYDRNNYSKQRGFESRKKSIDITLTGSPTRFKPLMQIEPKSQDFGSQSGKDLIASQEQETMKDESIEISIQAGKDLPEPPDQGELDILSHQSNTMVNMSMQSDKFKQVAYLPKLMGKLNKREYKSETQSLERESQSNFLRHTTASRLLTSQIYNSLVSPVLRKSSKALIFKGAENPLKTRNLQKVVRNSEDTKTVVICQRKSKKKSLLLDNGSQNLQGQNGEFAAEEGKIEELRAIEPEDLKKSANRKINFYQNEIDKISLLPSSSRSQENLRTFGRFSKPKKNECKCTAHYNRQLTVGDDMSSLCILSQNTEQKVMPVQGRRVTASPIIYPQPCGEMCKNTIPKRQRELIQDLITYEANLLSKHASIKNKRFLISAAWWRRWKDFVDFDACQSSGSPSRRQSQLAQNTIQQQLSYAYPGIISNSEILKPGTQNRLRRPLLEHYDFEALSPAVWKYLKAWYGCDFAITRLLIKDKSDPQKFILNLYPENLTN